MRYRREIDGLRAVAVLPVILFHAGFVTFSGGYVGVDVFFVISGYLITSIILHERTSGTFSLRHFYERRARRILPALFLVCAVTIPFAYVLMLPPDFLEFSKSLVAVSLFSSNFYFAQADGYFELAADLQPLLHTWSLGVEEQYYLLVPLLMVWALRRKKPRLVLLFVGIGVVSLAAAQWGTYQFARLNFFLLPTRAWELAIGAVLAAYVLKDNAWAPRGPVAEIAAGSGLFLIGLAVFAYDDSIPFPSIYALVPTLGTAMIIWAATPATLVGRVLASGPLVGIGLISYSAYLWHQPIFALARHRALTEPPPSLMLALGGLALLLAYLSWRFVEMPVRNGWAFKGRPLIACAAGCTAVLVGFGLYATERKGFRDRLPPNVEWWSRGEKVQIEGEVCKWRKSSVVPGLEMCEFGDTRSPALVFLYGDSHARALGSALDARLKSEGIRGVWIALSKCAVVPETVDRRDESRDTADCFRRFNALLDYVAAKGGELVVASRWTARLFPIPGWIEQTGFKNRAGGAEIETYREYLAKIPGETPSISADAKRTALGDFLTAVKQSGVRTYLVHPVPEIGWNISKVNLRHYQATGQVLDTLTIDYDEFVSRNRFVEDVFSRFDGGANIVAVRPDKIFCNSFVAGKCVAQIGGRPLYYDDDHVSDLGAAYIVEEIFRLRSAPAGQL